jgi:hypothetical protein
VVASVPFAALRFTSSYDRLELYFKNERRRPRHLTSHVLVLAPWLTHPAAPATLRRRPGPPPTACAPSAAPPRSGLADSARARRFASTSRVWKTLVLIISWRPMTWRAIVASARPIASRVIETRHGPRCLSQMASYDVASDIRQAVPRGGGRRMARRCRHRRHRGWGRGAEGARQGLTLVNYSAQPEPCLTQNSPWTPRDHPLHSSNTS